LAVWLPVFAIGSIMGNAFAQIGAILLMGAAIWIAWSAWRAGLAVDRES
jgi:hypothetical protein